MLRKRAGLIGLHSTRLHRTILISNKFNECSIKLNLDGKDIRSELFYTTEIAGNIPMYHVDEALGNAEATRRYLVAF